MYETMSSGLTISVWSFFLKLNSPGLHVFCSSSKRRFGSGVTRCGGDGRDTGTCLMTYGKEGQFPGKTEDLLFYPFDSGWSIESNVSFFYAVPFHEAVHVSRQGPPTSFRSSSPPTGPPRTPPFTSVRVNHVGTNTVSSPGCSGSKD